MTIGTELGVGIRRPSAVVVIGDNDKVTNVVPNPAADWWTTTEVAAYLGVQVGTVSSYRLRGQMPEPDMTVGRTHMWKPGRIIEWHGARPRPGVGGRPGADGVR